jgi:FtsP/CotA-like multicopper oxidase with cupredoxin domain
MDGVPGVTQDPIPPGGAFTYRFPAPSAGTYVYHTHVDVADQLPKGLYGLKGALGVLVAQ